MIFVPPPLLLIFLFFSFISAILCPQKLIIIIIIISLSSNNNILLNDNNKKKLVKIIPRHGFLVRKVEFLPLFRLPIPLFLSHLTSPPTPLPFLLLNPSPIFWSPHFQLSSSERHINRNSQITSFSGGLLSRGFRPFGFVLLRCIILLFQPVFFFFVLMVYEISITKIIVRIKKKKKITLKKIFLS